jgi:amino-acid N-acetyltransferase
MITIRRADVRDIEPLGQIINDCAEFGQMLHRSHAFLYEHVRDFLVADDDGRVVGVCGLSVVWANLAEVYSLAVLPECRGKGTGKQLVMACIDEARKLSIRRVMTLTYEKAFFERCGFSVVDRLSLPLKVWSECLRCSKNQACDEIAMHHVLEDVPDVGAPKPELPSSDEYVVPVTITVGKQSRGPREPMDEPQS